MEITAFQLVVAGIQALVKAYPMVKEVVIGVKNLIATLFSHGLITKEQQDFLFNRVDGEVEAHLAGTPPPHWIVEPDPTEPGSPSA